MVLMASFHHIYTFTMQTLIPWLTLFWTVLWLLILKYIDLDCFWTFVINDIYYDMLYELDWPLWSLTQFSNRIYLLLLLIKFRYRLSFWIITYEPPKDILIVDGFCLILILPVFYCNFCAYIKNGVQVTLEGRDTLYLSHGRV